MEEFSIKSQKIAVCGLAKPYHLLEHRVEHRGKVARRRINDLQYLSGGRLLLQGLARFGQKPRVLHCDHRLRREILQQRDLLVGEWSDRLTIDIDVAK